MIYFQRLIKKIITLLTLGFISHFINAQSITSFSSVSNIVCNGGSTTCLVTTNANPSATITYSLELDNGSGFGMYFGFPQNSNNQLTIYQANKRKSTLETNLECFQGRKLFNC